ncbi:unnamed protein product, partial [Scytosiphon promiscuus]
GCPVCDRRQAGSTPTLISLLMQYLRRPFITYCVLHLAPSSAFLPGHGRRLVGRIAGAGRCSGAIDPAGKRGTDRTRELRSSSGGIDGAEEEFWEWNADNSGGGAAADTNSWDDSSQDKWETLYAEGEKEKQSSTFLSAMADWGKGGGVLGPVDVDSNMPVEVVSFDLDDTLWSTMAVIEQANDALQEYMSREYPALAEKCVIADLMKEIWKERLIKDATLDPAPVNLTELRKAGLARACELVGVEGDASAVVESCFEVWRRARHDVEPHLFPGVLETLKALRDRGVRLVAITNGNAQTDDIPCLKDFFEFCVLAEQVGERKPQPGPFRAAVKRAGYLSENAVGGEWVHVGDDWASDCVGGKKMRMRTVLVRVPGKPAVGSAPDDAEEEEEEEPEKDDGALGGLSLDEDDDDEFPTLEDESLPVDESPSGKAQRLRQEQEKAKRRAEKLGILLDSDFEVAAGTAAANREKDRRKNEREESEPAAGSGGEDGGNAVEIRTTAGDGQPLGGEGGRAGEGVGKTVEERRRREEELEEEERKARAELKNRRLYGQDMSAIAMGHPEAAKGPGKMTSMGSSSYVVDM